MSYYQKHVFFCINKRPDGEAGCEDHCASGVHAYAKKRIKELGLNGSGKVRMNKSGCLDRCGEGPVLVVYPEGVWYTYVDETDVEEIIETHIIGGKIVDRLRLP